MTKVANTDPFKTFPGWNPIEKHKNYGQNQKASNMEPFGGNLWHRVSVTQRGNCRNSLSHFFSQKIRESNGFTKEITTYLVDLTKFFFSEREFLVFPHCE